MKVCIVGAGSIAKTHAAVYNEINDVEVSAIIDIDRDAADKLANELEKECFSSIHELLNKDRPDIIDICTPTYTHEEIAVLAANEKIDVLCEKPLSLNSKSARRIFSTAKRNNIILMTAQVIRFWPEYVYLKNIYDSKIYGKLIFAKFSRNCQKPAYSWNNWMLDMELSGRAPYDLHVHDADYIIHLLGLPKAVRSNIIEDSDRMSYISTEYVYDDFYINAQAGWFDIKMPFCMKYEAIFEDAIIKFDNSIIVNRFGHEPEIVDLYSATEKLNSDLRTITGYFNEINYFIDCVRKRSMPYLVPPKDVLNCLNMIDKEVRSAQNKKIEYIKSTDWETL